MKVFIKEWHMRQKFIFYIPPNKYYDVIKAEGEALYYLTLE